jgi:hypothetical protein
LPPSSTFFLAIARYLPDLSSKNMLYFGGGRGPIGPGGAGRSPTRGRDRDLAGRSSRPGDRRGDLACRVDRERGCHTLLNVGRRIGEVRSRDDHVRSDRSTLSEKEAIVGSLSR